MSTKDFEGIEWTRKPMKPEEVHTAIAANDERLSGLGALPHYHEFAILSGWRGVFLREMPRYFQMTGREGIRYLVNTEGYNYIRYATRIVGETGDGAVPV